MREWSPEVGAMRSEQGAGRLGRGFAGAGAARRGRRGCRNTLLPAGPRFREVPLGVHRRDGQDACA